MNRERVCIDSERTRAPAAIDPHTVVFVRADPERILLIRPSALGDVCRTVPALVSLRRRFPDARIDWLVRDVFADAVRTHPALNHVIPFSRDLSGLWRRPAVGLRFYKWLRELSKTRYDMVIDCQGLARSGVFALATKAPRRLGFARAAEGSWLACNERVAVDPSAHVVDRMLALVERAGAPPVRDMSLYAPSDPDFESENHSWLQGRYVLLAPTSAWPGKCWPADHFAQLALRLLDSGEIDQIVIVGVANERSQVAPLLSEVTDESRVIDLVGATSVGNLMRIISSAALVVANDSAAMHMAVGFSRPLVALLGPTSAELAGPYRRPDAVVQVVTSEDQLTHRACKDEAYGLQLMRRISVDMAYAKAEEQLRRRDASENGAPSNAAETVGT